MKAPVGLLSDRTVCDSRWRCLAPTSSQMYIRAILKNPVYCGKIAFGRRKLEKIQV